jgi:hypothetical protein
MGLFRRREPLHERLAREGGLLEKPEHEPRPVWREPGLTGHSRPREADAVVTTEAPAIEGHAARFVTLPDGSILVEDGPDSALDALAAAVERELPPPYRARAVRRGESLWAIEAQRIEVVALSDLREGDAIDLTHTDDATTLVVDGDESLGSVPALEQRGEREGPEYAVHAERLDGDLWEVNASPL